MAVEMAKGKRGKPTDGKTSDSRLRAFPPAYGEAPLILILGSMPGEESLRRNQYYAHPKNAFWPIMGELFGFGADLPYETRLKSLIASRIALWDVLRSCVREGSLDSEIRDAEPNDFAEFFAATPSLSRVVFNGKTAARLFETRCAKLLPPGIELVQAPSTSPAYASLRFKSKLELWREALRIV
jgi:TDG/mug DNA glycosylase family protein